MSEPTFRFLMTSDANTFLKLISSNRERFKKYFPITVSTTNDIKEVKNYIKQLSHNMKKKEMYPLGLFLDEEIQGLVIIKNIDWNARKCELGYYIDEEQEGKGITTILVNNTITYCFEKLEMNKIFLRIAPDNTPSIKVAEKAGFSKEGLLRQDIKLFDGQVLDMIYYGILRDEYDVYEEE